MKTCAFPFFLYVVYQSFRLCYRRSIQKKEYRRADKYHSQYPVKPACLPAAYIPYDKLRVLAVKNQSQSKIAASREIIPATAKIP